MSIIKKLFGTKVQRAVSRFESNPTISNLAKFAAAKEEEKFEEITRQEREALAEHINDFDVLHEEGGVPAAIARHQRTEDMKERRESGVKRETTVESTFVCHNTKILTEPWMYCTLTRIGFKIMGYHETLDDIYQDLNRNADFLHQQAYADKYWGGWKLGTRLVYTPHKNLITIEPMQRLINFTPDTMRDRNYIAAGGVVFFGQEEDGHPILGHIEYEGGAVCAAGKFQQRLPEVLLGISYEIEESEDDDNDMAKIYAESCRARKQKPIVRVQGGPNDIAV